MERTELLRQIKEPLQEAFGARLRGVLLYGSEARGESEPDSDVDLLVLLVGPIRLWADLERVVDALLPLQLEIIRPLHAMPVDEEVFAAGEFALYRNAKEEGIWA